MGWPGQVIALTLSAAACLHSFSAASAELSSGNELLTAIQQGDHNRLARALQRRFDPNKRLPDGSLLLSWAIEQQDPQAVRLLLEHGADINDTHSSANAFRPLIVACLHPAKAVLDQLLDKEPDLNVRGPNGITALSLCAAHAPTQSVQRMISAGARVTTTDDKGQTPLMWAAAYARKANFDLLVAAGADINRHSLGGFTPLMFAVKSGNAEIAAHAVAAGADTNQSAPKDTSLVQLAMYQGNYRFAEALINDNTNLNQWDRNGRQLLHAAVVANQPTLVQRLLDAGADVNALTSSSKVIWRYESNFRAGNYDFPILPPLLLAAQQGHSQLLQMLAERGADLKHRDADGNNVVLFAAASNVPAALEAALRLSPDANVRNNRGDTPLHRALASASGTKLAVMLQTLADHGARTDIANAKGKTAAEIAGDEHFKSKAVFAALFRRTQNTTL